MADDGAVAINWSHEDGTTGKAKLSANDADDALTGTWGFGSSDTDGGDWALTQTKRDAPAEELRVVVRGDEEQTIDLPVPRDVRYELPAEILDVLRRDG